MTYRAYFFKNDAEREAALADPRNKGLEYAKQMHGTCVKLTVV